jgi:REP element-mobilizing transposase RayT
MTAAENRPRLHRLELVFFHAPRYFIIACTHNRRHILATSSVHDSFIYFAQQGPEHGAWVGAYVMMPDHFHAFVAIDDQKVSLSTWAKSLKNWISKTLRQDGHWAATLAESVFFISWAAQSRTRRNGTMCARSPCEPGSYGSWKIGRSAAKFFPREYRCEC